MAKKKKKRKLKLKKIFICLILLLLIGYIFYYILMLPINNIYVKGNIIVKESEIISLANLESYPSFILTSSKKVKNSIKENKYIKEVIIKKDFKNKIYIEIEEYTPLCILDNTNILLSNGEKIENTYLISDIPYLVSSLEKELLNKYVKRFSQVDKNVLRQISQIEYLPVNVDEERFLLYMDDGNEVYITLTKIDKLNKYNEIVEKMDGSHGIVYLDSGDYIEIKEATEVIDKSKDDTTTTNTSNTLEETSNTSSDSN